MHTTPAITSRIRLRLGQADAHYGGELIDAAFVLRVFGDLATEIGVRSCGDEGLLSEYTGLRFTAPLRPGDFIEATAELKLRSRLRCLVGFTAHKVISARYDLGPSRAEVLDQKVLVCEGQGTLVLPWAAVSESSARTGRAGAGR